MTKQANQAKRETVNVLGWKKTACLSPAMSPNVTPSSATKLIYAEAAKNREALLGRSGSASSICSRNGTKVLEWNPPFAKWFVGGKLNASYNRLDRHIKKGLGNKTAIFWEGEPGEARKLTYQDVYAAVTKLRQCP